MPIIYVQADDEDFEKALSSVVVYRTKHSSNERMARFTLDGMVVLSSTSSVSEFSDYLRALAKRIDQAEEACIRGMTMDELQLTEAAEDLASGF